MTRALASISCLLAAALLAGCANVVPRPGPVPQPSAPFSHAELDQVLHRFVDDRGRVDYAGLVREPAGLERYYALLGGSSPDSDPARFPDDASRLAYWINAYNGSVLKLVKDHHPITSVEDVRSPAALFFVPGKVRFFAFNRILLGGEWMSLYQLENGIVRARFPDPRIHFALNCASLGCPRLPREAFDPARLEDQLQREARAFVSEPRNFEIQHEARTVWLSAIFDWYEGDFTGWVQRVSGGSETTLLEAVARWLPPSQAAELRERTRGYRVRFRPYDWGLNDRATAPKEDA